MSTDLTFITNEPEKTLRDRFAVLLGKNTNFFDCLVGYFFVTGFHLLRPALEKTEKIRILIGIATNHSTLDLIQTAKAQPMLLEPSHAVVREQLPGAILSELQQSVDDTPEKEDGAHKFVEWIKSGKLEVRAYPSERVHAKLYIMTFHEGDRDKGRVITGSSNFSKAGLQDNLEFNVELKSRGDYDFAIKKFNDLWDRSVDVGEEYVTTINEKSPFAKFAPYELYLKFLYEYFRSEINVSDNIEDTYFPVGFKKLAYQEETVVNARRILNEHGGVFLSDVVGLGKTYMSAMLAKHLDERCLVIASPHLLEEANPGSWTNVFREFGVRGSKFESRGRLDNLARQDLQKYTTVFIDESHWFRNEDTQSYDLLKQICYGKKVVLVSATPLNNTPPDILNQIKLFQPSNNSNIPNIRNLDAFFGDLQRRLKGLDRQNNREQYLKIVKENAIQIRQQVLKFLMIRRTRNEIEKYYDKDLKQQDVKFPEVENPTPIYYKFNEVEAEVFDKTIERLTNDMSYARYTPLAYYTCTRNDRKVQSHRNFGKTMKILIVKRLESSFTAFRFTLERFIKSHEKIIAQFREGYVFISESTHYLKLYELLEADDQAAIEEFLKSGKVEKLDAKDFEPNFISDLENDLKTLKAVRDQWKQITRDPKWDTARDKLQKTAQLKDSKLIIFTESKETAAYLHKKISTEVEPKVLLFSGSPTKAERLELIANFDANAYSPKNDYRILVTTEVLAEGVNLHRSNVVMNYDIPWNPTRLIQRVGRINRVDTKFRRIFTYNFFPTDEGNDLIKLREAAVVKIHGFIQMLGADARLLTDEEEIDSHHLFRKWNSREAITGEDENEETELKFLAEIRAVRDEQPDIFERIKRLPKKARSTRMLSESSMRNALRERPDGVDDTRTPSCPALVTYFRQDKLDKFFITPSSYQQAIELDFMSAAKLLKPIDLNETRQRIPHDEFYDLLNHNKAEFKNATTEDVNKLETKQRSRPNHAYLLKRLKGKEIRHCQQFTEDDDDFVAQAIRLVEDGTLPKVTENRVAAALKETENLEPLKVLQVLRHKIPPTYFEVGPMTHDNQTLGPRQVVLSSLLVKQR